MSGAEVKMKNQEISINWTSVLWYIHLHFLSIYALWLTFTEAKWMTVLYVLIVTSIACIGVTVGAHRYYAHRTFTAVTLLRVFFVIAHTLAGVGSIHDWVLLHRIHHKYFGTDKDPYNFNKGFFRSHFIGNFKKGYLEDTELVKTIDMRDVEKDGFVWLQHRCYWIFSILLTLISINVPIAYWNESLLNSFLILVILRLTIGSHVSWLVNSAIIVWGLKPTDKLMPILHTIRLLYKLLYKIPKSHGTVMIDQNVDDLSVFFMKRSYWPNYHYIFPRDWKSSEFGNYNTGCGTLLIKFWYELGLVDMLMTMSSENAREVLYNIASKKTSVKDAKEELEKLSVNAAIRQKLCYMH